MTAAIYAPSVGYGFRYEDVNDFRTWSQPFQWSAWWETASRSLTALSFAGGQALSGVEAWGFHLVSILWHLLNGVLVTLLARRVASLWAAVGIGGLFLLHPVQVESVAYISSQGELVAGGLLLVALLVADRQWWKTAWLVCGLAVLAKETAVAAFLLVPLWGVWRGVRVPWGPWLASCLIPAVLVGQKFAGIADVDPVWMVRTAREWLGLLSLWVVPWPLSIEHDWSNLRLGLAAAGLLVIAWSPWRLAQAAVIWSAVAVLPRLFAPQLEGLHEHHVYSWAIALSVATGLMVGGDDSRTSAVSA